MKPIDEADPPTPVASARQWLRTGEVSTPTQPRRSRRVAALMFVIAFLPLTGIATAFLDHGGGLSMAFGGFMLVYLIVLGALMIKVIRRR